MQPWHYISFEGNLGLVPEEVADAALVAVKEQLGNDIKDPSCNLPAKASLHVVDQICAGNTATTQRDLCFRFVEFAQEIARKGSLLLCVWVDFASWVHFRSWNRQGLGRAA
jgi:hypothetical protein